MAGNYAQLLDIINNPTQHGLPAWDNNAKQIEGETIQQYLLYLIQSLTAGYQFMGVASTNTSGGTPDQNVFYIAGAGTYNGFGPNILTVDNGCIGIIRWNGTWSFEQIKVIQPNFECYIIGRGNETVWTDGIQVIPGKRYKIHVKDVNFDRTGIVGFTFLINTAKNTTNPLIGLDTIGTLKNSYSIKVPSDADVIYFGGRASSGTVSAIYIEPITDVEYFNINSLNDKSDAYSSKTTARNALPSALRSIGNIITYLLADGWHTEQFIGSDIANWTTTTNWSNIRMDLGSGTIEERLNKNPQYISEGLIIDLGELGNYSRPTGSNDLSPYSKAVTNIIPYFIGLGNSIRLKAIPGYNISINYYHSNATGAARTGYIQGSISLANEINIPALDDYITLSFSDANGNDVNVQDFVGYGSLLKIYRKNILDINQYYNKIIGNFSSVNIADNILGRGSLLAATGLLDANGSRVTTGMIPVAPGSRLKTESLIVDGVFLKARIFFYNLNENGVVSYVDTFDYDYFNDTQTPTTPFVELTDTIHKQDVICPPNANLMRLWLTTNSNSVPSAQQIEDLFTLSIYKVENPFKADKPFININGVLSIANIDWLQGFGKTNYGSAYRCITAPYFKVYPGQRIQLRCGNSHYIYRYIIQFFADIEFQQVGSKGPYYFGGIITIPDGVNYIKIIAYGELEYITSITPEECKGDMWYIIDVTGKNKLLRHSKKIMEVTRSSYAQGMAIQNGYLFQAFADGYIDIYDLNTKTLKQSLFIPLASDTTASVMHGNNLTFGPKYDNADPFGILWVNNNEMGSAMVGIRIGLSDDIFSFTKIYELIPPEINGYKADDVYIDFVNNRMVQLAYKDDSNIVYPGSGYGNIKICLYKWTGNFQDGNLTEIHSFENPVIWAMQGGRLIGSFLYLISGSQYNDINVFNVDSKELVKVIDLTNDLLGIEYEAQGIDWDGNLFITSTQPLGSDKWYLHELFNL